jgi:hypothetical protein
VRREAHSALERIANEYLVSYLVYLLLVELASLGILLRVAGQACPYTLPRDMVSVGWWKRGWELIPILTSKFGRLDYTLQRRRGIGGL